jgi:hypothetical protein
MGWWSTGNSGGIEQSENIWGDEPADILDQAIIDINDAFMKEWGRLPTTAEWRAGFAFNGTAL